MKYGICIAFVASFAASLLIAFTDYWYLIFIPEVVIGLFLISRTRGAVLTGLAAGLGTVVQIVSYEGSYRVAESSLVSGIAGIPGGSVTLLLFTAIISFVLATLGAIIGSSFSPMMKRIS